MQPWVDVADFSAEFAQELEQLFAWRRDVRRFREDLLPQGELESLVRLAAYAPSVGYSQPARFVRVAHPQRRQAICENYETCNARAANDYADERAALYRSLKLSGLREAPVHLAVFLDRETSAGSGLGQATMPLTLHYSVAIAIHTLWLASRARGIGVGWVSILDPAEVTRILDVPASWEFIAYLCIGYPQEEHLDRELVRHGWEEDDPRVMEIVER